MNNQSRNIGDAAAGLTVNEGVENLSNIGFNFNGNLTPGAFAAEDYQTAARQQDMVENYHTTNLANQVNIGSQLQGAVNVAFEQRLQGAAHNSILRQRYALGNAGARFETDMFNARPENSTGFNVDLNDDATRLSAIAAINAQSRSELTTAALTIAFAPVVAAGLVVAAPTVFSAGAATVNALRTGASAARLATASLGRDISVHGFRTAFLARAPQLNTLALEGAAMFTEGAALSVPIGGGVSLAARNFDDLSEYSARLAFGNGATFEGGLYRSVPVGRNPLEIHPVFNAERAVHRYTGAGQGGLYLGSSQRIVNSEFTGNGASIEGLVNNRYNANIEGLLDLTNPSVRTDLGVSLDDLVRTGGSREWRYEVTNPLGRYAEASGYNGIIAPAAQADGGVNLILFNANLVQ